MKRIIFTKSTAHRIALDGLKDVTPKIQELEKRYDELSRQERRELKNLYHQKTEFQDMHRTANKPTLLERLTDLFF